MVRFRYENVIVFIHFELANDISQFLMGLFNERWLEDYES